MEKESESLHIYGKKPVLEAINSNEAIEKIYMLYGSDDGATNAIRTAASKRSIKISTMDKRSFGRFEKNIPKDAKTQGVIAMLKMITPLSLHEIINISFERENNPVLVVLDGINDPHNLGAIARAAECSGASGVIIPQRDAAPITPVAMKTSAGALNHIPVGEALNLNKALEDLKNAGFWIAATDMNADHEHTERIYDKPTVIIIGSEGKGVRPSTLKHCDFTLGIKMAGKTESLNASVAAGIILFEILRQKRKSKE